MTPEEKVLKVLSKDPKHIDIIVSETGLSMRDVSAILTMLMLEGKVTSVPGMRFLLFGDAVPAQ